MLNRQILEEFTKNFYGYGNLNSDIWFIALEEGGGANEDEIQKRINVWNDNGKKILEDCKSFHISIGIDKWFLSKDLYKSDQIPLQSVWRQYIRFYFFLKNNSNFILSDNQNLLIKRYQRDKFGKLDGEFSILELRPLPSKNMKSWIYGEISDIEFLKTREKYENFITEIRITKIKELIKKYKPKKVFFFSTATETIILWKKIINQNLNENLELGYFYSQINGVDYFILEHPISRTMIRHNKRIYGLNNNYYEKIGNKIFLDGSK